MALNVEEAIKKYAGGDDAYALKLKSGIRDAMGYSNYQAKLKGAIEAPINSGNVGNMDPATIARNRAAKAGINQDNVQQNASIVDTIDKTSGALADAQAARERAAAKAKQDAMGLENGVTFTPKDKLDEMILQYQQNPKNADGSVKSLQQFEAETNAYFGKDMFGPNMKEGVMSAGPAPEFTMDDVNKRIAERVPKDFIGNEDKYSLMSQGYSEKQAKEFQGALRYDTMSAPEKLIYQVSHPEMAKKLETGSINKSLIQDMGTVTDPATGQTTPKYTYDQLKEKYPNVQESDLKQMVAPAEKKALNDDISQWLSDPDRKAAIADAMGNKNEGFKTVSEGDNYKKLKVDLKMEYGSVFTDQEIDQMIYNSIRQTI